MEAMNGKTVHEQTPTMAQREAMRRRPKRGPVMYQRWYDLLFLHWAWDAAEIQATLPAGLTVDTFDGQAWLGVVPFAMSGVRPRGLPAVGGLSAFLELNLRTYVHAADGTPGVWFYSLDCEQRLAVMIARTLFGLPYRHARMARRGGVEEAAGVTEYSSRRAGHAAGEGNLFTYRAAGEFAPTLAGSLAWWLVERYVLFSCRGPGSALHMGRVWHAPYRVAAAEVGRAETTLFGDNGFVAPGRAADHSLVASGVDVSVFPLRKMAIF